MNHLCTHCVTCLPVSSSTHLDLFDCSWLWQRRTVVSLPRQQRSLWLWMLWRISSPQSLLVSRITSPYPKTSKEDQSSLLVSCRSFVIVTVVIVTVVIFTVVIVNVVIVTVVIVTVVIVTVVIVTVVIVVLGPSGPSPSYLLKLLNLRLVGAIGTRPRPR